MDQLEAVLCDAKQRDGLVGGQRFGEELDEIFFAGGALELTGVEQVEEQDGESQVAGVVEGEVGKSEVGYWNWGGIVGWSQDFFEEGDGLVFTFFFDVEGVFGESGDVLAFFVADYDGDQDQVGADLVGGGEDVGGLLRGEQQE